MTKSNNIDLPIEIDDKNQETMVNLWWTSTLLKKKTRRFFTKLNSSDAQFNLLETIRVCEGPLTQKELSEILLVDKSNITGLLDRAEKDGLIVRKNVPGDRRSYHIELTDVGMETVLRIRSLYEDVVAQAMSEFSAKEKDELIRLTRKMRTAIEGIDV